ncbi:MAG: hypothetical protein K2P58_02705 [Hyphomonadaceae bacterium]|nr:hypothetical protein [Hyphomonadaceae bacterium]
MKLAHVGVAVAALSLVACGQPAQTTEDAAPAAPQSLIEQVQAMAPEQQPVFAWEQLTAWQQANPQAQPPCASIRRVDTVGVIPEDVAPDTLYAGYKGNLVFTVQCGPQLTTVGDDPREQWLVAFAPGATEAAITSCANAEGRSQCPRIPRRAEAATTTP